MVGVHVFVFVVSVLHYAKYYLRLYDQIEYDDLKKNLHAAALFVPDFFALKMTHFTTITILYAI